MAVKLFRTWHTTNWLQVLRSGLSESTYLLGNYRHQLEWLKPFILTVGRSNNISNPTVAINPNIFDLLAKKGIVRTSGRKFDAQHSINFHIVQ